MKASTQIEAIQELLIHLQKLEILSFTSNLFSYINNKEKMLPCAAEHGIAYPHSTSIEIEELTCVLGISKIGIDFNSPDGQLYHLFLLTLSLNNNPYEHQKFITHFRTIFNDYNVRSYLLDATESNDVINIVQKWEKNDSLTNNLN